MKIHEYSVETEDAFSRTRVHTLLVVVSVLLVSAIRKLFLQFSSTAPDASDLTIAFWIGAFGPLTVFGLLLSIFDKILWRTWLGRALCRVVGFTPIPNIGGLYAARTEWVNWPDKAPRQRIARVTIRQTWSRISITMDYVGVDSHSSSITAHMRIPEADCDLIYAFEFRAASAAELKRSGGTQYLHFAKRENGIWESRGFYYTENGDCGRLDLTLETKCPSSNESEADQHLPISSVRRPKITVR